MAFVIPIGYVVLGALGVIASGCTAAVIVHKIKEEEIAKLKDEDYVEVEYELAWTVNGKQMSLKNKFKGKKKAYM